MDQQRGDDEDRKPAIGGGEEGPSSQQQPQPSRATASRNPTLEELEQFTGQRWTGRCKWFNVTRGFGFLVSDEHTYDVFVHQSELQMQGFRSLDEGEVVSFTVRIGKTGLEASNVTSIEESGLRGSSIHPLGKKRKDNRVRCFKCGFLGFHLANKCPRESQDKVCYNCQRPGHFAMQCPEALNPKLRLRRFARQYDDPQEQEERAEQPEQQPGQQGSPHPLMAHPQQPPPQYYHQPSGGPQVYQPRHPPPPSSGSPPPPTS